MNTPKVVSGHRRRRRCARSRRSTAPSSTRSCPSARPPTPSWSSCSRTPSGTSTSPSSTSWRCSPATSASTSGAPSTPPRPSRSGTCGSRPGPGVGGHCLPIDPSYLVVAGRSAGSARRSGSSSWPTTSTSTCPTTSSTASRRCSTSTATRGQRQQGAAARARYKAGHVRLARVAVDRRGRAPPGAGRRRGCVRPVHPQGGCPGAAGAGRRLHARRSWPPPTWSCCSSITPTSPSTRSPSTPRCCSTPRASCAPRVHRRDALTRPT